VSELLDNLNEIELQKASFIIPKNLKKNVKALGVTGTLEYLDTSDATAQAKDIKEGQTAYVNDVKVTGNLQYEPSDFSLNGITGDPVSTELKTSGNNKYIQLKYKRSGADIIVGGSANITANLQQETVAVAANITADKIKKDEVILGVTGTYEGSGGSGDVKLFDTIEHMQQDTTAQEGDLAVVYGEELTGITGESEFDSCMFPNTVVLDKAFTDSIYGSFRAVDMSSSYFDGMIDVSSSSFRFDGFGDTMVRVQYTSSDGITYTRTDGGAELVEFGTAIKWEDYGEPFNDVIGNFMKIDGDCFEGLYKYYVSEYMYAPSQLDAMSDYVYGKYFYGKNGVERGTLDANAIDTTIKRDIFLNIANLVQTGFILYDGIKFNGYTGSTIPLILNTSNVINMSNLFNSCYRLIDVPNLDTAKVVNMDNMFSYCYNINTIPNYNISNVHSVVSMFSGCYNLTSLPNLDTSNVTDMNRMLNYCNSLTTIPNFNTSNVITMCYLFNHCYNLVSAPRFDTSNVTDITHMFYFCNNLTTIPNYNTQMVTRMISTFAGCSNLTSVPNFNTSNVVNMSGMFSQCNNLTNIPNFDTSMVTNMRYIFAGCYNLTNIPNFDTSNTLNMCFMFNQCNNLTSVPNLDTSSATDMSGMFSQCTNLTVVPYFNTGNVSDMSYMFSQCGKLLTVSNFNTTEVKNMYSMFSHCTNLINIPNFNTAGVNNCGYMFMNCIKLTTVPSFNASNVTSMIGMFYGCNNLSDASIQNIINMCLNSRVQSTWRNLSTSNSISPFYNSNVSRTKYQNRWSELTQAGWSY